jgi:hypothetical protein
MYNAVMLSVMAPLEKNGRSTNTPAYLDMSSITKEKSLIRLTPGFNVIELFSFVTDDKAQ